MSSSTFPGPGQLGGGDALTNPFEQAERWPLGMRGHRACPTGGEQNVGDTERLASSVAGACLLANGLLGHGRGTLVSLLAGGAFLHRGMTGRSMAYRALGVNRAKGNEATVIPAGQGEKVQQSIAVMRTPAELYSFWRELENLPKVMKHLKSVEAVDRVKSHWVAVGPLGKPVEWDAEVFNDQENEMIAWRSLPGSEVDTAGSVHFTELPHGRGTEVTVSMKYNPPAGKLGAAIAALTGHSLETIVEQDLRRFKALMETGEVPTTEGQTSGRTKMPSQPEPPQSQQSQRSQTQQPRSQTPQTQQTERPPQSQQAASGP